MKTEKPTVGVSPGRAFVNFEKSSITLEILQHGTDHIIDKYRLDCGHALDLAIQLHKGIIKSKECKDDAQYQSYLKECKEINDSQFPINR